MSDRLRPALYAALAIAAAIGLYVGWDTFWFLCDDAYIAFRYVSNSQFGLGYTWNPPPWQPVEGYTSFLWVWMLDQIWTLFGVEPPDSSNWLSLAFSYGALAVVFAMGLRIPLSPALEKVRPALLAFVLVLTVGNRTFLAWTSSGLETAMETFLLLLWLAVATLGTPSRIWLAGLVAIASVLELCRPDGLLYLLATALIAFAFLAERRRLAGLHPLDFAPALPTLAPIAHLLWRHATYGWWLPNTYYAKHVAIWPLAGVMYVAAFMLEYAYWIPFFVAIYVGAQLWGRFRKDGLGSTLDWLGWDLSRAGLFVGLGTVAFHDLYYTLAIGGDHFEYRIFQHLVPLLPMALVLLLDRFVRASPRQILLALLAMLMIGSPIPWMHWYYTKDFNDRSQTYKLRYPIAPHLPLPVRFYGLAWDALEDWLIDHFVGSRHQGHKVFLFYQQNKYPTREEGLKIDGSDLPVYTEVSVGWPAWVLPHVAIIDKLGLNDVVIAHSPAAHHGQIDRTMAHDRRPPKGYLQCFRPNVTFTKDGRPVVTPRKNPLTAQAVESCETKWLTRVLGGDVDLEARPNKPPAWQKAIDKASGKARDTDR